MSWSKVEERTAKIQHKGITVGRLRELIAACDDVGIPDTDKIQFTGHDADGTLMVTHRITLDQSLT